MIVGLSCRGRGHGSVVVHALGCPAAGRRDIQHVLAGLVPPSWRLYALARAVREDVCVS